MNNKKINALFEKKTQLDDKRLFCRYRVRSVSGVWSDRVWTSSNICTGKTINDRPIQFIIMIEGF